MIYKIFFLFFLAVFFFACGTTKSVQKEEIPKNVEDIPKENDNPPQEQKSLDEKDLSEKGSLKKDPPHIQKQSRKPKGRFKFSGDEFVKENGYNPFEKKNDTVMQIRGHAKVSTKNLKMSAPQIEIYGSGGNYAYAKGPVEIFDTKNQTRILGNEALFLRGESKAILRGNIQLRAFVKSEKKGGKKEQINLTANELERRFDTSVSLARGNVVVKAKGGVLYANEVEFFEEQDLVHSSASPRIFTESDLMLADIIEWKVSIKTVDFKNNVRAFFNRTENDNKKKVHEAEEGNEKTIATKVRAEEARLVQKEELLLKQKLTLQKNVVVERKDFIAYAQETDIFGASAQLVKARKKVKILNKTDKNESYGDFFEWRKESGYMSLGAMKGNETRTILFDKNGKPTAQIYSASATRANEDANPQAKGDVRIIQLDNSQRTAPASMGGEWAEIDSAEKIIRLYGRPYVEGEMGRIGARNIILYYEERRYEMLGIETGVIEKQMNRSED